jgi:diguanylate cyclase (GGDEF)-like protein
MISINAVSLLPLFGASVVGVFALLTFLSYLTLLRDQILLNYSMLLMILLPYVLGYAMYTSSITAEAVIFWSRVCYTGVSLAPIAFHLFTRSLSNRNLGFWGLVIGTITGLFIHLLWSGSELILTSQLVYYTEKAYFSLVRGEFYQYFAVFILVHVIIDYIMLLLYLRTDKVTMSERVLFIVAIGIWIAFSLYDGIVAMYQLPVPALPWAGPTLMAFFLIIALGKHFLKQREELFRIQIEKEHLEQRLNIDDLTGLHSRSYLLNILDHELKVKERSPGSDCVFFIDIDEFKSVNDNFGHLKGDDVLYTLGSIIRSNIRNSDIAARVGGDEFILLLFDCSQHESDMLQKRIDQRFQEFASTDPELKSIEGLGLSIGKHCFSSKEIDAEEILEQADKAMYLQKRIRKENIKID